MNLKNWSTQLLSGIALMVVITVANEMAYPTAVYPSFNSIVDSGRTGPFYIILVLSLVSWGLILVGAFRGLAALARKFRSFVRMDK